MDGISGTVPGTSGTEIRYIKNNQQGISRTLTRYIGYGPKLPTRKESMSRDPPSARLTFYLSH